MSVNGKVMVVFTRGCSPYLAGERASFPAKEAERLVKRERVAKYETDEVNNANDEPNAENGPESGEAEKPAGKAKSKKGTKGKGKRKRVKIDD